MSIDLNGYDGTPPAAGGSTNGGFDWGALLQQLGPLAGAALGAYSANRGTTTTQTQNNIPEWQRPYLEGGFQDAARLYGQGPQQYYPGSTVAPMSQPTLNALGQMTSGSGWSGNIGGGYAPTKAGASATAGGQSYAPSGPLPDGASGNPWGNVQNYLSGSVGSSSGAAQIPGQQSAISNLMSGGGSATDPYGLGSSSASFFKNAMGGANGVNAQGVNSGSYGAADTGESGYVHDVMGGKYLDQQNPYADRIASQIGNDIQARVGSQFGGAGRTMSGAAARALAEQTGDATANFRGGLYENERNRMTQASDLANAISGRKDQASQFNLGNSLQSQMFNSSQGMNAQQFNAGQRMNAAQLGQSGWLNGGQLGLQSMLGGINAANALGGRQDQANQFGQNYNLAALGMLPGMDQARMAGNREQLGAGQVLDQYGQQQLNDQVNRFNFGQQSPWDNLTRYMQMVGGNGYGGTSSSFTPGSPFAGALGGLQLGAGIFGQPHG